MTQPTHNEVKAWLDKEIAKVENQLDAIELYLDDPKRPYAIRPSEVTRLTDWTLEVLKRSLLANRAVLERHKPIWLESNYGSDNTMSESNEECLDDCGNFPCPTYTDIAEPIRSVMG